MATIDLQGVPKREALVRLPWLTGISVGLCFCANVLADSVLAERTASLGSLFPKEQVERLASILPPEQSVRWQVFIPNSSQRNVEGEGFGAMVFVSPTRSGAPPKAWVDVLERHNLIYVGAEDFGNNKPTAQRILAVLMGLALVQREFRIDTNRTYVAGMSGGGRVASRTIVKFPHLFSGALYIVGVDFWTETERALVPEIISKRYVFLTGTKDFNRRDTKHVYERYRSAGARTVLLMDLPGFGHEYPNATQFEEALKFLDRP